MAKARIEKPTHPDIATWLPMLQKNKKITQNEIRRGQKLLNVGDVKRIPPMLAQEGLGENAKVYVRLFAKGFAPSLYVLEIDPVNGQMYVMYFDTQLDKWQYDYAYIQHCDKSVNGETVFHMADTGAVVGRVRFWTYERESHGWDTPKTVAEVKAIYKNRGEY